MNADVRNEIALMKSIGWREEGKPTSHVKMRHAKWGLVVIPCSPSDHRWRANHRAELARRMETTLSALLRELGLRAPKREGRKRARRRGRPKCDPITPEVELHDRRVRALHKIIDRLIDRRLERLETVNSLGGPSEAVKIQSEIHALEQKKQDLDRNPPSNPIDPRVVRRSERVLKLPR